MLKNRLEELELSCVRELKIRRGVTRTADLNMMDDCIKESVFVKRAMEQRKDEAWTLELGELRCCFVSIMIFSGIKIGHVSLSISQF